MTERTEQVLVPMRLTQEEKERLYAQAKAEGVSANELVRRLVRGETSGPAPETEETVPPVTSPVPSSWSGGEVLLTPPIPPRPVQTKFHWPWEAEANAALKAGYVGLLLIAPHGMGKSFWAANRAAEDGLPFFLCTGRQSKETLEGQHLPKPGTGSIELVACDGIVTTAAQVGGRLLFEEFTMLNPDSQDKLLTALNTHGGTYDVSYRGGSIQVHPRFQVIATANPPRGEYLGTDRLNHALLSRWYVQEIAAPSLPDLLNFAQAIGLKYPANKPLCELAIASYAKQEAGEWDNIVSPREIALFTKGIKAGLPEKAVFFGTIANKFAQGRTSQEQAQIRGAVWTLYADLLKGGKV